MAVDRFEMDRTIKGPSERSFGLTVGTILGAIALWRGFRFGDWSWSLLGIALALGVLAFVAPSLIRPLNKMWMKLGHYLQKIILPLILGVFFFFILTPVAFFLKVTGRDVLRLRFEKSQKSYFDKRNERPADFRFQF